MLLVGIPLSVRRVSNDESKYLERKVVLNPVVGSEIIIFLSLTAIGKGFLMVFQYKNLIPQKQEKLNVFALIKLVPFLLGCPLVTFYLNYTFQDLIKK